MPIDIHEAYRISDVAFTRFEELLELLRKNKDHILEMTIRPGRCEIKHRGPLKNDETSISS